MKIYITKPIHSKYGHIKLDTPFATLDYIIQNSRIWFKKPHHEKPFLDIFDITNFCYRGWGCRLPCILFVKNMPHSKLKETIITAIKNSIHIDLTEDFHNKHYKWCYEIDVKFIRRETPGNFDLYLTKPSVHDLEFAGIDRAKLYFQDPYLNTMSEDEDHLPIDHLVGKLFRKNEELYDPHCIDMWNAIKSSFNVPNDENFLNRISKTNHKENQGQFEFVQPFYFDLIKN